MSHTELILPSHVPVLGQQAAARDEHHRRRQNEQARLQRELELHRTLGAATLGRFC